MTIPCLDHPCTHSMELQGPANVATSKATVGAQACPKGYVSPTKTQDPGWGVHLPRACRGDVGGCPEGHIL